MASQSRGRTPLHAASAHGTLVQLRELLDAQPDQATAVNAQDANGLTPLMLAAKALNVEACVALLNVDGIDVNVADSGGKTALHHVCAARPSSANDLAPYTDVLETLFDKGAVARADAKGNMPLHVACEAGNYTALSAILEHSPDGVSIGTPLGWRPLHFAAKSNRAELIPMLLRRGADTSALCTLDGSPAAPQLTPLGVAKHFNSAACIEVLEKSAQRAPAAAADDKPSLANNASGRSIRRVQGAADVKSARLSVSPQPALSTRRDTNPDAPAAAAASPAPANRGKTAGYDMLPAAAPANARPSGPGYQHVPGEPSSDGYDKLPPPKKPGIANRPAAALPPGAGRVEVQSEYDAVPRELRAAAAAAAAAGGNGQPSPPRADSGSRAPAMVEDSGNEYDAVPEELHRAMQLKEQQRLQQRKSVSMVDEDDYAKAPPPIGVGGYDSAPALSHDRKAYQSVNLQLPQTGTIEGFKDASASSPRGGEYALAPPPSVASGQYAAAPVPLAGGEYARAPAAPRGNIAPDRYASIPGEKGATDNQYDAIPTELAPTQATKLANGGSVGRSPARSLQNSGGAVAGGGGVGYGGPQKAPKPVTQQASQPALSAPPLGGFAQVSLPHLSNSDPAASSDLKVALSTQRIGRHHKATWSRQDAENFLRGKPPNTFVLRPTSQKDGVITLSFVHPVQGNVQHSLIYLRDGGYTFGEEFGCPPAGSLLHLLQWQKLDV